MNGGPKVVPEAAVCFSSPPINERSINLPRFPELAAELQLCVLEMAVVSHEPIVDFKPARSGIDLSIPRVNKFMYENGNFAFFPKNVSHFTNAQVFMDRVIKGCGFSWNILVSKLTAPNEEVSLLIRHDAVS